MTVGSSAQDAIALLIDLAQKGEIDPWDVQVIDVIDRCLSELAAASERQLGTFEADLSQSGQAFLYASMLVLLKADTLGRLETEDDSQQTDTELDEELELDLESQLPLNLEKHIRRRPSAQPLQKRPVTLQELINQLQEMAAAIEETAPRPRVIRPGPQSRAQAVRAIEALAHHENLTEMAKQIDVFLAQHWQRRPPEQDWLAMEQLVELWDSNHLAIADDRLLEDGLNHRKPNDRVGVFWALLLLSAQSKVELSQEEFYQEIKIRAPQDF